MYSQFLVITGCICLAVALVEAWSLVAIFSGGNSSWLARKLPGVTDLIKSHIDYLMMSMLLFIIFLLLSHYQRSPEFFVIFSVCAGSIFNPFLFLVRAINPSLKEQPSPGFRLAMLISCLLTTVGYIGSIGTILKAAIASM
jgi:hypothetical protein